MEGQHAQNRPRNREEAEAIGLRPFKPGQSGNPGGRPKTRPISEQLEKIFSDELTAAKLAKALADKAEQNPKFAALVLDRLEGKVIQQIELSGTVGLAERIEEGRKRLREYRDANRRG